MSNTHPNTVTGPIQNVTAVYNITLTEAELYELSELLDAKNATVDDENNFSEWDRLGRLSWYLRHPWQEREDLDI